MSTVKSSQYCYCEIQRQFFVGLQARECIEVSSPKALKLQTLVIKTLFAFPVLTNKNKVFTITKLLFFPFVMLKIRKIITSV